MHKTVQNLINIQNLIKSKQSVLEGHKIIPQIIAVSKTFKINHIIPLIEYGHIDYGENKVQEAVEKWSQIKIAYNNIIGKNHYDGKRYRAGIRSFQNTLRLSPRNGMAFYYMGMSNWGQEDIVTAMKTLSKAVTVDGGFAKPARGKLEILYKASNNGSLDGLERRIKAAASELK